MWAHTVSEWWTLAGRPTDIHCCQQAANQQSACAACHQHHDSQPTARRNRSSPHASSTRTRAESTASTGSSRRRSCLWKRGCSRHSWCSLRSHSRSRWRPEHTYRLPCRLGPAGRSNTCVRSLGKGRRGGGGVGCLGVERAHPCELGAIIG